MKVGNLEKVLHEWQYGFSLEPDWAVYRKWALRVWCVWIKYIPMPYNSIGKKDYYGFIWTLKTPHATEYHSIKVPRNKIIRKILPYEIYRFPIRWSF